MHVRERSQECGGTNVKEAKNIAKVGKKRKK